MRRRRLITIGTILLVGGLLLFETISYEIEQAVQPSAPNTEQQVVAEEAQERYSAARENLTQLTVKGRAPKTGYSRTQFGSGWATVQGCSVRDIILYRDLQDVTLDGPCKVVAGRLNDAFTGEEIMFDINQSSAIQIDHLVALSDAWQKGAQNLSAERRREFANDPLVLLAVSGPANQQKGDGDAATWLPSNVAYRCDYIERQIRIKKEYALWVTTAEKEAMGKVLAAC